VVIEESLRRDGRRRRSAALSWSPAQRDLPLPGLATGDPSTHFYP